MIENDQDLEDEYGEWARKDAVAFGTVDFLLAYFSGRVSVIEDDDVVLAHHTRAMLVAYRRLLAGPGKPD